MSDRFHVAPLARAVSFPYTGLVLVLAQNSVRLVEVTSAGASDIGAEVGIPASLSDALGRSMPRDTAPSGRLQGAEGQKVLVGQFARKVDGALRSYLAGKTVPLILAAVEHVGAIYRSVNSYPFLVREPLTGNYERTPLPEIGELARHALRAAYDRQATSAKERFLQKQSAGLGMTDLADVARAATAGAVQTLLFDIESVQDGTVDDAGAISFAATAGADSYDVIGEVACRVLSAGGDVVGLRKAQMPDSAVAAILRYVPV